MCWSGMLRAVLCCAQVLEALLGDGIVGVSWGLNCEDANIQVIFLNPQDAWYAYVWRCVPPCMLPAASWYQTHNCDCLDSALVLLSRLTIMASHLWTL
jgi:hypothetical protein